MDLHDVSNSLETLWFYSSVLTSSAPSLPHLPISYPSDSDDEYLRKLYAKPLSISLLDRIWSWLEDSVKASGLHPEFAKLDASEPLQDAKNSTVISQPEEPVSKGRIRGDVVNDVKSVKNVMCGRRCKEAAFEYDYLRRFECCHLYDSD